MTKFQSANKIDGKNNWRNTVRENQPGDRKKDKVRFNQNTAWSLNYKVGLLAGRARYRRAYLKMARIGLSKGTVCIDV